MSDFKTIFQKLDWDYIKTPTLTFLGAVLACTTLWWWSYSYVQTEQQKLKKIDRSNHAIAIQIQIAKQDAQTIRRYRNSYLALVNKGIIGSEHRLQWVSGLRDVSRQLALSNTHFKISPRGPAPASYIKTAGSIRAYRTQMNIRLGLPHEIDLLRVLGALEQQPGHFTVSDCKISRTSNVILLKKHHTNLNANCNLDWYSISTAHNRKGAR